MNLEKIIAGCFIAPMLIGIGGIAYAYVFDVDPAHVEKEYSLERAYFDRTNCDWNSEFPDFPSWVDERNHSEAKFREGVCGIVRDVGMEQAAMWDMYGEMIMGSSDSYERGDR